MIYKLGEQWNIEYSPIIDDAELLGNEENWQYHLGKVATAHIGVDHPEVAKKLAKFHCIPVGSDFPFVSKRLADYLRPYVENDVYFHPAEISYKKQVFPEYFEFVVKAEVDCLNKAGSVFTDNGRVTYAQFNDEELNGHWVSNLPTTHRIVQVVSQPFVDLIKNSEFADTSFEFLAGCVVFPTDFEIYFNQEMCKRIAAELSDPDYLKNPPQMLRVKRPDVYQKRLKIRKLIHQHYRQAAEKNWSKDQFLDWLVVQAMPIAKGV